MPVYEFRCEDCSQIMERVFKVDECPDVGGCSYCEGTAKKILPNDCGLRLDTPSWLTDQVRGVLQRDGEPPIETRTQHREYLKRNGYVERG